MIEQNTQGILNSLRSSILIIEKKRSFDRIMSVSLLGEIFNDFFSSYVLSPIDNFA